MLQCLPLTVIFSLLDFKLLEQRTVLFIECSYSLLHYVTTQAIVVDRLQDSPQFSLLSVVHTSVPSPPFERGWYL